MFFFVFLNSTCEKVINLISSCLKGMEQAHEEQMHEQRSEKQLMLSYPPTDPQSYPWLVICDGYDKEKQTFFSISKDYFHTRNIPKMRNKLIYTSCDGWLVGWVPYVS